ncbi:hypothetical protein AJ80_06187 [Polytolypa hystricis UAMH7299]|uniref:Zn(2)-C6 fungal-type domain-containing protein n=1 Tax=Polytolypa hystricis (strain UAMH7299) TaxID=1447883 RepID=A0A2B7XXZ9_POLH7|nr:hypothetical protein AJ80_06187 [Polytolypa hystricis UAMH7299]
MAAVASATVVNGNHENGKPSSVDHSPSRFTAVNGRDQSAPPPLNGSSDGQANAPRSDERADSLDRGRPSGQVDTPSHGDDAANALNHDQEESHLGSDSQSGSANRNKRKRSESDERHFSPSSSGHTPSLSRSPMSRLDDQVDPHMPPTTANGTSHTPSVAEPESTPKPHQPTLVPAERPETIQAPAPNVPWDGYDPHLAGHNHLAQQIDSSDAQLAEALQRDAQVPDAASKHWVPAATRPESEPLEVNNNQAAYPQNLQTPQDRPQAALQVGPKRKRVFSNRTKTGCMTCRRRKKKCDEQKPSCNNCLRGGFLCEGYSSRSTWQKPSNAKGPVPLQSKNGYSAEVPNPYAPEMSPQRHDRAPTAVHPDNGKPRTVSLEEGDRTSYIASPPGPGSRSSWSKGPWPATGPQPYMTEHGSKPEYRDGPPVGDMPRPEQPKADYHVAVREMSQPGRAKTGVPIYPNNMEQRPGHPPHVDASSYSAQARLALNNMEPHVNYEQPTTGKTEKEKMVDCEQYRPLDPVLVKERERCKAALWRYNNAGNPLFGIDTSEKNRLLKQVLIPTETPVDTSTSPPRVGTLGPGAIVEAPFNCHYGYNISIGEDVFISENCFFIDDCSISIGAHTWIGPGVTILSSMAIGSMQERKGSQSRYQGRPVVIAEDCWIGAGCTIMPGVSLGRGAYIAPGEVVRSQILPYGFQGLKPSYP